MPRVLLILALVATAFWVFTIVDCAVQPPTRHRGVSKPVWILIVVLLPVLGGLLWLSVGRMRAAAVVARSAPDDDPAFLGQIGTSSEQDERIRRLEEELAQLDSEDDDPKWNVTHSLPAQAPDVTGGVAAEADDTDTSEPTADGDDDPHGQRGAVG
ncbi:PLDc N-terminal domain-containing protein (plasmid) [Coraliomargarita sp. W4R53]